MNPTHISLSKTIFLLYGIARPHRRKILLALALTLISSLLEGLGHSMIIPIVQSFMASDQGVSAGNTFGIFTKYLDWFQKFPLSYRFQMLSVAVFILFMLRHLMRYAQEVVGNWAWLKV